MKIEIIKMYKYYLYQFFETNNLIFILLYIFQPLKISAIKNLKKHHVFTAF